MLVKFSSVFHNEHGGPDGIPTLLEARKEYLVKTGTKSACFEDLKVYPEMLEEPGRGVFKVCCGTCLLLTLAGYEWHSGRR